MEENTTQNNPQGNIQTDIQDPAMVTSEENIPESAQAPGGKKPGDRFGRGFIAGALAMVAFVVVIAAATAIVSSVGSGISGRGSSVDKDRSLNMTRIGNKLEYMQSLIDRYYLYDDEDYLDDAEDWIYRGFVYSIGDPYTVYYDADEYMSLTEDTEGEYCGIGVVVSQDVYTGLITVIQVFEGSPAEEAGMLPGDILYMVGDIYASGEDLNVLVNEHIRGEEGTFVDLTMYRESDDEYIDMTVERRFIETSFVEYEMLDDAVGYITFTSFDGITGDQFAEAYDELEKEGMEYLIIDIRNNGGGLVDTAEQIADYLMPDDLVVVSFKGKGTPDSTYIAGDGHASSVPVAVIVNGQSASASEVLTGALKDNGLAIVVGTQTYGKGIAQGIFAMGDGSALKLTTAYYYTPSGECIHEIGITPDVVVELDEELKSLVTIPKDEDNQIAAAKDALLNGVETANKNLASQ